MTSQDNEHLVRAFYAGTAPGHREALWGIQSPEVVYDMPAGMPVGSGHFEGLVDITDRFLTSFYGALDVELVPEEFIVSGDHVVVIGRIAGKTRNACIPVDVPFVHVWTVRDGLLRKLRAFTDTASLAQALARERADERASSTDDAARGSRAR